MSLKNPVTPPEIDPGTVRLVTQRLNHYATPGPSDRLCTNFVIYFKFMRYVYTYRTKSRYKIRKLYKPQLNLLSAVSNSSLSILVAVMAVAMVTTRVGTLIVATVYLQLIQNRYMFRSFTVLQCSHQHCVQPVASDVEVVGYL